MPTKLLAKNFPEDVQERLKPRLEEWEHRGMKKYTIRGKLFAVIGKNINNRLAIFSW